MVYDPLSTYTVERFKQLPPEELQALFKEAKAASSHVSGIRLIKKVVKDIAIMRRLLHGYDSLYNGAHQ